jgi:hypothetical protein
VYRLHSPDENSISFINNKMHEHPLVILGQVQADLAEYSSILFRLPAIFIKADGFAFSTMGFHN